MASMDSSITHTVREQCEIRDHVNTCEIRDRVNACDIVCANMIHVLLCELRIEWQSLCL